jgi:hypothetical protein
MKKWGESTVSKYVSTHLEARYTASAAEIDQADAGRGHEGNVPITEEKANKLKSNARVPLHFRRKLDDNLAPLLSSAYHRLSD